MKSRALIIGTILSLVIAIMIPEVAAAKGGKPTKPEDPSAAGVLYGDLVVVERDGAGVPLLKDFTYVDGEHGEVTVACLQPLAYDCSLLFLWGDCIDSEDCDFDPEAHDACEVHVDDAEFLQEVSFGRGSVTRSQSFVIDSRYAEFLEVINDAEDLRMDPAGRVQMYIPTETVPVEWFWKTVDAPLENLGMYKAAMSYGCFHFVEKEMVGEEGVRVMQTFALDPSAIVLLRDTELGHLVCDYFDEPIDDTWDKEDCEPGPCWWEDPLNFNIPDRTADTYLPGDGVDMQDMNSATAFLAGATDKGDPMSLDEAITINTYIGINLWTLVGSKKDQYLEITYFPFATVGDEQFTYDRETSFPTGTTADLLTHELDENFRAFWDPAPLALFDEMAHQTYPLAHVDLDEVNLMVCRGGDAANVEVDDEVIVVNACDSTNETDCGGANWFAQATEHARKTVWYLHNWEVPELDN